MTISATTQGLRPGVCTSSSRPSSPFDGMVIYETDTNRVAVYDTNTWVYKTPASTTGSVLQVVSTTKTDTFTSSSLSTGAESDVTGLSASITPASTSNKILVMTNVVGSAYYASNAWHLGSFAYKVYRGSTAVGIGDAASNRSRVSSAITGDIYTPSLDYYTIGFAGAMLLDSPSTTSSTTYKVTLVNAIGRALAHTMYVNRQANDGDSSANPRATSTITLIEIAG